MEKKHWIITIINHNIWRQIKSKTIKKVYRGDVTAEEVKVWKMIRECETVSELFANYLSATFGVDRTKPESAKSFF